MDGAKISGSALGADWIQEGATRACIIDAMQSMRYTDITIWKSQEKKDLLTITAKRDGFESKFIWKKEQLWSEHGIRMESMERIINYNNNFEKFCQEISEMGLTGWEK